MRKNFSKKNRFLKLPFLFAVILTALAALGLYIFALDLKIKSKFESRRWNLPSRVYSDAYPLYPGQNISLKAVESKLQNLAYKKTTQAKGIGEYAAGKDTLSVFLHNFSYPSGDVEGFLIKLEFTDNRLKSIKRSSTNEELKTLKLEPELIASIFDEKMEDRTLVTLAEIPDPMVRAVIALEDERFYSHHGIDPLAILRALAVDLFHLRAVQGASTLTQQLVKNYFLSSEKTIRRKINEILMSAILEARYSKEDILESYFNEIYFGQRGAVSVTGVEEASKMYFSKGVSHLTLAESALLAGMIRSPGEYSPFRHMEKAYDRRNFVLKMMKEKSLITDEEYEEAKKEKIVLAPIPRRNVQASHFVQFVQTELKGNYPYDTLKAEGMRIFTTLDMEAQEIAENALRHRLEELEQSRKKIKKFHDEGKLLESAFIAIQPQTGWIRTYIGGRDFGFSQFDRILEARRQPGSTFKPFVYLAALLNNHTLASSIEDSSLTLSVAGKSWKPANYDKSEHGPVSLREALEQSYNLATTRLAMEVGLDKIIQVARDAGIESRLEAYPSLALGAFEVTPFEMIRAYTIFPNEGTRSEPLAITKVVTRTGDVLEKKGMKIKKVVPEDVSYLMNSLLRGVMDRGTATSARLLGFTSLGAGKTGTTSDYRDSWFIGYTPDLLALSWIGYDDNTPTGLSGASGALPIWVEFMNKISASSSALSSSLSSRIDFRVPPNIVTVDVAPSGGLYKKSCGEPLHEIFIRGTEPNWACDEKSKNDKDKKGR